MTKKNTEYKSANCSFFFSFSIVNRLLHRRELYWVRFASVIYNNSFLPVLVGFYLDIFMADQDSRLYRCSLLLLILGVGFYALLGGALLYVLRRKRMAGAVVEEEEEQVSEKTLLIKEMGDQSVSLMKLEMEVATDKNLTTGKDIELEENWSKPQEIDEDLHSWKLAVYGRETMR
ncbi:hypothetical protein MA16_Dca018438 [Dendrobium catenatum]|uniref:Uncharacterized protein n=1 Tax=Dendrobium catenatum TaxID=906689 RepID=A0A2I0XF76_9ASPA|nr:hypothetical protein MA16_Dca018438 [Dendrobium catenatum]